MILLPAVLQAQEVRLELEAEGPQLLGRMKFDEKPASGDSLDLSRDLGMDDFTFSPGAGAGVGWEDDRLEVRVKRRDFRSEKILSGDRRFNETLFSAGEEVRTRIAWTELRAGWERAVWESGFGTVSAGAAARHFTISAELSSPGRGGDEDHLGALLPEVSVGMRGKSPWEGELEVAVTPQFSAFGLRASAVRGLLAARLPFLEGVALSAGFRYERLNLESRDRRQDNSAHLEISGPFASLEVVF